MRLVRPLPRCHLAVVRDRQFPLVLVVQGKGLSGQAHHLGPRMTRTGVHDQALHPLDPSTTATTAAAEGPAVVAAAVGVATEGAEAVHVAVVGGVIKTRVVGEARRVRVDEEAVIQAT